MTIKNNKLNLNYNITKAEQTIFEKMQADCQKNYIACLKNDSLQAVMAIVSLQDYKSILEIGTGIGFSTVHLAKAAPNAQIITLERSIERADCAKKYFAMLNMQKKINCYYTEANDFLTKNTNCYDVIFFDASMGQYSRYFKKLWPFFKPGSLLIADNMNFANPDKLPQGKKKSRFNTMQKRLAEFKDEIAKNQKLTSLELNIGDGLFFVWRIKD